MKMKTVKTVTIPLTATILVVALLNVFLLCALGVVFVEYELGHDLSSFLLEAGRERSLSVARQLALDLGDTPTQDRNALLERYDRQHGVTFVLVDNNGTELAGPALGLPNAVRERVTDVPTVREGERGQKGMPPRGGPFREGMPPGAGPPGEGPPREGPPPTGPPLERRRPTIEGGRSLDGHTVMRFLPQLPGTPPFLMKADGPLKYWVGVRIPIRALDSSDTVPGTLLLASSSLLGNTFYFQPQPWLAIALVTLGVTLLCWLPLVRGVTRSVSGMTRATADIAEGRFNVGGLPHRRDELGALAGAIRSMAGRLKLLVEGQRRFLADAAHELRSPLARISLSLGLIERVADEGTRRHVDDLREDVEQMTKLTDDLLAFARADLSRSEPRLQPASLSDAATRAAKLEARQADVRVDIEPDIQVRADPDLLVRAISNVIRNAVAYAGSAGTIRITAASDGDAVRLSVADQGPGIANGDLEKVFSAFYRPESSRDRRTGGTGLGLAIARSAIEACRGSIACRNLSPAGLEVSIRLPRA
jgi:two-component system sensor histidine kinase CpxA